MAGYFGKNYEKDEDALVESSQEATNSYDYSQDQNQTAEPNPFEADDSYDEEDQNKNNKVEDTAGQDAPVAANEEARAQQANNGQSYVDTAIANTVGEQQTAQPDPVAAMQKNGLDADTISALQQIDQYAHTKSPEEFQRGFANIASQNKVVADLYMQYYVNGTNQTQAPQEQQAPTENQILPSAGGNYQADKIYDPSKTYGRQPDGTYQYSYSAKQLQNDLAKEGYYKGNIDGYFGQQTQQALDNYLKDNGILAAPSSTEANKDVPMSQDGSMSAAQQQATQPQVTQQATNPSTKQAVANTTGENANQPNTFWEQIQRGWDKLWHGDNNTQSAEPANNSSPTSNQPQADYEPYSFNWFVNEYKTENPNASEQDARQWAGQQIIGIQNGEIERPKGQVYGSPRYGGVEEKPWNLTVDSMKEDLARMEQEGNRGVQEGQFAKNDQQYALWHLLHPTGTLDDYYRIYPNRAPTETATAEETSQENGSASAPVYGTPRTESPTAESRKMSYNTEAPPQWIPKNDPNQGLSDLLPNINFIPEASADEMRQIQMESSPLLQSRSLGGRPAGIERPTPSVGDIAMQQQLAELEREWNNQNSEDTFSTPLTAEERYARIPETQTGYNTQQPAGYTMQTPSAPTNNGAYSDANRKEAHSPEGIASWTNAWTQTPEYQALERQRQIDRINGKGESMTNYYSKMLDSMQTGEISSDDIQSSGTSRTSPLTAEERLARIPDTETGYNTPYTAPNYFEEEQNTEEARNAMESNYEQKVPTDNNTMYLFQYISDMDNLKKQFPNYSDSALMDMMLVNEEMRNGQSSYYKWLANNL